MLSGEIAARRKSNASNDNKVVLTKALRVSIFRSVPSTLRRANPTLIADESEVLIALETHFRPRNEQEVALAPESWCLQHTAGYNLKINYARITLTYNVMDVA